jgi:omega-6 fatty acid desaturase (delta-12 desaturase)
MEVLMNQSSNQVKTKGMQKSDTLAIFYLVLPFTFFGIMLTSLDDNVFIYSIGQLFGAIFFAQSFILLHELGHRSFFKSNKMNTAFGYFFSILVFIPYYNWLEVHELHHKWTGWRDKDPTTEKTFSDRFTPFQENLINFSWKFYIPLFTIGYRFGIYWKTEKLKRHLSKKSYTKCLVEMFCYGIFYFLLILLFPGFCLSILPALYLSFIITDILSLSQHSHIEMPISNGEEVVPLKYKDQSKYSRSLVFSPIISEYFLFNFNFHEHHHAYPGLPCYHLSKVQNQLINTYSFLPWLKKVKSMKGVDFIFKTDPNRHGF